MGPPGFESLCDTYYEPNAKITLSYHNGLLTFTPSTNMLELSFEVLLFSDGVLASLDDMWLTLGSTLSVASAKFKC